ncbi:MAG: hypothetical protein AAF598_01240 [Bacteroidota bacterium]
MRFIRLMVLLCLLSGMVMVSCSEETENTIEICTNTIDDDGDGLVDCDDPNCSNATNCQSPSEICDNTIDDDGDGLVDCNDPDCTSDANCPVIAEICNNSIDDDGDGLVDCDDPDCIADFACPLNISWSQVSAFDDNLRDLKVYNNQLFVAGDFKTRESSFCVYSCWLDANNSITNQVTNYGNVGIWELAIFDSKLYGAGPISDFVTSEIGLAEWNGTDWDVESPSFNSAFHSIHSSGPRLFLGGVLGDVAFRTPTTVFTFYPEITSQPRVNAVIEYDGKVLAAGEQINGGIVELVGSDWQTFEGGTSGAIEKLFIYDGNLIVAGDFDEIGGKSITDLAYWDGSEWFSLGGGITSPGDNGVQDMVEHNGSLYVVGDFQEVGNLSTNLVARWNGSVWQGLSFSPAGGFLGYPTCVEVFNDRLYIGTTTNGGSGASLWNASL